MSLVYKTNDNGSLRPYTPDEIAAMGIMTRGIVDGSHPTESRRVGASTTTRKFFCAWEAQEDFLSYMLGAVVIYDDSGTDRLSRLPPQRHPRWPDLTCASLDSLTGHKFVEDDPVTGMPVYELAECVFQYDHFPFNATSTDEFTPSERSRYFQVLPSLNQVDYLSLPGGVLRYIVDGGGTRPHGSAIQHGIGFPQCVTTIKRKWVRLPFDAYKDGSTLRNRIQGNIESGDRPLIGSINSNGIMGYTPGVLLLIGVEEELYPSVLGEGLNWDLTFTWLHKAAGHNWFYFFETNPAFVGDPINGYYFVGKGSTFYTSDVLPDDYSLFYARDHAALTQVG